MRLMSYTPVLLKALSFARVKVHGCE